MSHQEVSIKMLEEIKSHNCGNKIISKVSRPKQLQFGAECLGCRKKWLARMAVLRSPGGVRLLSYLNDPFATR